MSVQLRNNVRVTGEGPATLVFSHGFGCDQNMWRFMAPYFAERFKVVVYDLVGNGQSDLSAYYKRKYDSLDGYASDLLEVVKEFAGPGPVIHVGHSVGSMIGAVADLRDPGHFAAHVMVGPSPCYINDGDYVGGFTRQDIVTLLSTLAANYFGWASTMAPAIMGAPDQPELGEELTQSFCRTNPEVSQQFARVTFTADNRKDVAQLPTKTLVLQCNQDFIAPLDVGDYLQRVMPDCTLRVIDNIGHCPHMSNPDACIVAMDEFFGTSGVVTLAG
ncbi:alpha/beta hydrolase [Pseudomonas syringae]|uniref:alpha/beta fold hydrolase n=1 Tax=Pseudomonas quasicaspiana TaxID=2829821 RepID=UPI001E5536C1|nr:alpha/beta hydrolase [Pseudomonas quasicaspiana]MCD5978937.1 alpha/beta hydrolase [Pseudomonas quasicaspiana]MCQ3002360.1 alpha/beta hydrolase [Pseudomonas syringae]